MKIQLLCGNLGNQIRHYSFVRFAERKYPQEKWFFDDSSFFLGKLWYDPMNFNSSKKRKMDISNDLERVFHLKLNLLSRVSEKKMWEAIIERRKQGYSTPQILLDLNTMIVLFEGRVSKQQICDQAKFSGKTIFAEGEHLGFHPKYIDLPYDNIYYHAEWASRKWFDAYAEENRKELQFPPLKDSQNLKYAEQIDHSYSVGVHVRRGDFQVVGWDLPAGAYKPACQRVLEEHPNTHFFIFSDDLDWCRENENALGFDLATNATYVYGNTGENSYIDMQLLSMCKGMIRNAASSFSQLAGWLNPQLEFEVKIKPEAGYSFKIVTM